MITNTRPLDAQLIDGLCSLLTLADEARQPGQHTGWTAQDMARQIRDIVGGPTSDGSLWQLSLRAGAA